MNQDKARHSVFKFFSTKYADAKDDSNVVKVEHFSGSKLDMEVSILKDIRSVEGDRNLAISIHAYKGHDKDGLKKLLDCGWAPDGWVCKDIKLGQDNGLTLWKFFGVFELDQWTTDCLNHPPMAFLSWQNDGYRLHDKATLGPPDLTAFDIIRA